MSDGAEPAATDSSRHKAEQLLRLHHDPAILVLVNVWDVASARTVAALPGCRAIATASWSIAAAQGVPDHEHLTRDEMLAAAGRIAAAVDLPVTADLEAGYGATARDVGDTIAQAISAGIVGANLEDRNRPVEEAAARVAAARERADDEGVPFVVNARLDMPIATTSEVDEAVARARVYLDAGADCIFPIRITDPVVLADFVARCAAPVNAFGRPGGPSVAELEALGVARVSFGPGPMGAAMAALRRAGSTLLDGGPVDDDLAFRPPVH
jgi:2-methylisocitrate lyase-like PEP mutase family enzyme